MRLFVNPTSPFCRAATVYLDEKSAGAETVALTAGADRARLLAVSPYGEVPVLETDHGVVAGSYLICEWADMAFPEPELMPAEPVARLECRRLTDVACSTTDAMQFLVHLLGFRRPEITDRRPELTDRLDGEIAEHYTFLEATLGDKPFFAGRYSRADIFFFMMITSLAFMGRPVPRESSALRGWLARMRDRPTIARNMETAAQSVAAQTGSADPYFRTDRIHWRSHRVEWACRLGLATWLAQEIEDGRAFFTPPARAEHVRDTARRRGGPYDAR